MSSDGVGGGGGGDGGADPVARFDFAADARWRDFLTRFDIVGQDPAGAQLERLRRRFYREYVDPNFDPDANPPPRPRSPPAPAPAPAPVPAPAERHHQQRDGEDDDAEHEGPSAAAQQHVPPGAPPRSLLWTVMLVCHLSIVLNAVTLFLPGANFRLLMSAIVLYTLSFASSVGRVRLSREFFERVSRSDDAHFIFLALVLFAHRAPAPGAVSPVVLYSLLHLAFAVVQAGDALPALLRRILLPPAEWLARRREWAQIVGVQLEMFSIALFVIFLLFGQTSIFVVVGYYYFLRFRFRCNSTMRSVFYQLRQELDNKVYNSPRFPQFLRRAYDFGMHVPTHADNAEK